MMASGRRYRQLRIVGKGSFGCCWLVQSSEGTQCILKQIDVSRMQPKQRQEAENEVKVLSTLRHPFIISFRESFVEDGQLCIITDYAERGDLFQAIRKQRQAGVFFPESLVLRWFSQITLALKHMHDRKILHRDLKTQNIFLSGSGEGTVKLGDFGIARVLQHTQDCARTAIGTPYYLSPEICMEKPYDYKSDVWSLGCVLFELATLEHAFDAESMRGLVMKILRGNPPQVPLVFSAEVRTLVPELLKKDPRLRPSIDEILQRHVVLRVIKKLLREAERQRAAVGMSPPVRQQHAQERRRDGYPQQPAASPNGPPSAVSSARSGAADAGSSALPAPRCYGNRQPSGISLAAGAADAASQPACRSSAPPPRAAGDVKEPLSSAAQPERTSTKSAAAEHTQPRPRETAQAAATAAHERVGAVGPGAGGGPRRLAEERQKRKDKEGSKSREASSSSQRKQPQQPQSAPVGQRGGSRSHSSSASPPAQSRMAAEAASKAAAARAAQEASRRASSRQRELEEERSPRHAPRSLGACASAPRLSLAFQLHLEEFPLARFDEGRRRQLGDHVARNVCCERGEVLRVQAAKLGVVVDMEAAGFLDDGHVRQAAADIQNGGAISREAWGTHRIRLPDKTVKIHSTTATPWLRYLRQEQVIAAAPAAAVASPVPALAAQVAAAEGTEAGSAEDVASEGLNRCHSTLGTDAIEQSAILVNSLHPTSPHPQWQARSEESEEERTQLLATLRDGLRLGDMAPPAADSALPPSDSVPEPQEQNREPNLPYEPCKKAMPAFLKPDGQVVDLQVGERDSLTYRIEALKVYLESELGLDDFLRVYWYLNENSRPQDETVDKKRYSLESMVSAKAITFLPLVHQLIVCEDECYLVTSFT
eukprot:TRINITY_DN25188_c0_g1_i1.p1 TRINITY_DN25188_c0_g1~~TRINITY_DN25188_c0_g1_i1.p1  ORF type:complete len:881 (-),score=234.33 TRINITY_DN25188_c0_g1_i1:47-2689(-)